MMNTPFSVGHVAGIADSHPWPSRSELRDQAKQKRKDSKQKAPQERESGHDSVTEDKELGVHLDREV